MVTSMLNLLLLSVVHAAQQRLNLYEAVQHRWNGPSDSVSMAVPNPHLQAAMTMLRQGRPEKAAATCIEGLGSGHTSQGELHLMAGIAFLSWATDVVADHGWSEAQPLDDQRQHQWPSSATTLVKQGMPHLLLAGQQLTLERAQRHADHCLLIARFALEPTEELLDQVKTIWFQPIHWDMEIAAPDELVLLRAVSSATMHNGAGWNRNRLLLIRQLVERGDAAMARTMMQHAIEQHTDGQLKPAGSSTDVSDCSTYIAPCELSALHVLSATAMPAIYSSAKHVRTTHLDILSRIQELRASAVVNFSSVPSILAFEPKKDRCITAAHLALTCDVSPLLFRLSFLGLPERRHLESLADVFRNGLPELVYTSPGLIRTIASDAWCYLLQLSDALICVMWRRGWEADNEPKPKRKRVAFVMRLFAGVVLSLPRAEFETTVICVQMKARKDNVQEAVQVALDCVQLERCCQTLSECFADAEHYWLTGTASWSTIRKSVAAARFDVIVYLEIGMDLNTYFLAHARLAPVQAMTFGHSSTSGLPTMDYFITHATDQAQEQYTERLISFSSSATFTFAAKRLPSMPLTKEAFRLPTNKRLYVCTQKLEKLHPAFDALIQDLLAADPNGVLVFIDTPSKAWYTPKIWQRWRSSLQKRDLDRLIVLPQAPGHAGYNLQHHYMDLIAQADVLLDSFPFGGCTSSIEALVVGVPIVTLPGATRNGLCTEAALRYVGLAELVAANVSEYVHIAVKLATNLTWRTGIWNKLDRAKDKLLHDKAAIEEWAEFLRNVTHAL